MKTRKIIGLILCLILAVSCISFTVSAAEAEESIQNAEETVFASEAVVPENAASLTITDKTATTVTLSWSAADGATHYRIYKYDTETNKYTVIGCSTGDTTECSVTGLAPGTSYTFAVRPFNNSTGKNIYSASYTMVTGKTEETDGPANATGLTVTSVSEDSATLTWDDAKNITHYRIYKYDPAAKKYTAIAFTNADTTEYTATKLNSGTTYKFAVRPFNNSTGKNIYSPNYTAVTFDTVATPKPENATGLTVSDITGTTATLKWDAAEYATYYRISKYDTETDKYTSVGTVSAGTTEYKVTGLTPETDYTFAVQPFSNASGLYVYSSERTPISFTTVAGSAEEPETGMPTNIEEVIASDVTKTSAVLTWDAVENATHYRIYKYDPATKKYTAIAFTEADTTEYTATGLNSATSYKFAVRPFNNSTGKNIYSPAYTTVTFDTEAYPVPASATELKVTERTANSVSLKWDAAENATHYRVYTYDPETNKYTAIGCTSGETVFTATELVPGKSYIFAVCPFSNASGRYVYAPEHTTVSTKTAESDAPTNAEGLTVTATTENSVTLSWDVAANTTHYRIFKYDPTAEKKYTAIACVAANDTEYTITGLAPETEYTFAVRPFSNVTGKYVYSGDYASVACVTD